MFTSRLIALVIGFSLFGTLAFAAEPIKIMSYNIRYGTAKDGENHWDKRKEFLVDTIKAFDPDLLGTQEVLAFQRDYLSEKFPGYAVWGQGRDDGKEKGEMTPVYWKKDRFEKIDGGHFWLSASPDKVGVAGWDAALPRVASWVKLRDLKDKEGKTILFLNTHFDHIGRRARSEAGKLIRDRIDTLGKDCSVILSGDFNSSEKSDAYKAIFDKKETAESPIVDTYRSKHPTIGKEEGTANNFKASLKDGTRIDWIGVSRDFTISNATIDRTAKEGRTPSDHFAITAEIKR
jgi:endonuclease/exonuclease/phosphatase family metal-dependent hydrolase